MGLFMDSLGLPMCYGLFPGNTNDCLTLKPIVQKLQKDYSVGKILESLSKCNCSNYHENYYLFDYYDTVLKDIGTILNINFALKNSTLQDIKKILSSSISQQLSETFYALKTQLYQLVQVRISIFLLLNLGYKNKGFFQKKQKDFGKNFQNS